MMDLLHTYLLAFLYERRQYSPRTALASIQRKRLERLVAFARKRSPFFRELYRNVPERNFGLSDLPPVTKSMMLENFDAYVTDRRLSLGRLRAFVTDPANIGKKYRGHIAFHTSGTVGEPAVIVFNHWSFNHLRAANLARGMGQSPRFYSIINHLRERLRVTAVVMDGGLYPSYSNFIHLPRLASLISTVQILSLRDPVPKLAAALQAYQPGILMGYPSILTLLAEEQLAGRLSILKRPAKSRVACLGEPLTPEARRTISRAFACPIINIYGAGECLPIAQSCDRSPEMHVNEDLAILEVVDEAGRPVPPGTEGAKVFLTNLVNRVQPFIRFEITDLVTRAGGRCACGRTLPLIKEVSGRTDDVIHVARPGGGFLALHPYWLMAPLLRFHELKDWQVTQTGRNTLTVSLVTAPGAVLASALVEETLRRSLAESSFEAPLRFVFQEVAAITPDPATGKIRRIWSAIGRP